jgi:hypothetical protein
MNERITQLAEQATSIVEMVGPEGYTSSYAKFNKEKFAELIVQECVSIADEYDGVGSTIVSRIKKHFGVEE